jgi:hypothetical protein
MWKQFGIWLLRNVIEDVVKEILDTKKDNE